MQKQLYTITENRLVATDTYRLSFSGSGAVDGEFVHLDIPGFYLRRPLSVCDTFEGGFMLLYKTVGEGTRKLATLPVGTQLSVLTGLGRGFDASACTSSALLVGGGLGAALLLRQEQDPQDQDHHSQHGGEAEGGLGGGVEKDL